MTTIKTITSNHNAPLWLRVESDIAAKALSTLDTLGISATAESINPELVRVFQVMMTDYINMMKRRTGVDMRAITDHMVSLLAVESAEEQRLVITKFRDKMISLVSICEGLKMNPLQEAIIADHANEQARLKANRAKAKQDKRERLWAVVVYAVIVGGVSLLCLTY